jgi:hypothetical protein
MEKRGAETTLETVNCTDLTNRPDPHGRHREGPMTNESARPDPCQSRQLLAEAISARQEYADYLWAVAAGHRTSDPETRERLKARCEETFQSWSKAQNSWFGRTDTVRPRPAA